MPPKKKAPPAPATAAVEETAIIAISEKESVITRIRTNITKVKLPELLKVFVQGDAVVKQVSAVKELVRVELIARRDLGAPCGKGNRSRVLSLDPADPKATAVTIQARNKDSMNHPKIMELLRTKDMLEDGTDFVITSTANSDSFQKFLKKHRADLKEFGLVAEHVVNETKVQALVTLKRISDEELLTCIDVKPFEYAVVMGAPKPEKPEK